MSQAPPQLSNVSIHNLQAGFRSKREMHAFLMNDGRAYLPKQETISIEFMKDIVLGKKEVSTFQHLCAGCVLPCI